MGTGTVGKPANHCGIRPSTEPVPVFRLPSEKGDTMTVNLKEQLFENNAQRRLFGLYVQQSHASLLVYEQLLDAHHDDVYWICELGTGTGALSLFWALWARLRSVPFLTVDIRPPEPVVFSTLQLLGANVQRADCLSRAARTLVSAHMNGRPGLLLCDNGNKVKELQAFAPLTPPNSLILAHDFADEILPTHVESVPEVAYYQPWHDQSIALETKAAVLRRVDR